MSGEKTFLPEGFHERYTDYIKPFKTNLLRLAITLAHKLVVRCN